MSGRDPQRNYSRRYSPVRKADSHGYVTEAVRASGGRVIFSSGSTSAPLFLGVELPNGHRAGVVGYVFHASQTTTKNRPVDEHRGQVRYGDVNDKAWRDAGHPLGFDPAGVDITVVLVVDEGAGIIVGLDPFAYDPLPIGNSIYFREAEAELARQKGWHVWERDQHASTKRQGDPELETMIGFTPDRFLDYLALERRASSLGLDASLRFRAAEDARAVDADALGTMHQLERDFQLSSHDLLSIIDRKGRLAMAMRGGVAEHHLGLLLAKDPAVSRAEEGTKDGPPDFFVSLATGRDVTVECKNASPKSTADGTFKVEIQKTRTSKSDPLSRFYQPAAFDVVAACLYGPTKQWRFQFCRSDRLSPHPKHPDRIAPIQRIDDRWRSTLSEALD